MSHISNGTTLRGAAMLIGLVLLGGCTGASSERAALPKPSAATPSSPSGEPSQDGSQDVVIGPDAVRVTDVIALGSNSAELSIVGPAAATYSVETARGTQADCSQKLADELPGPPSGMPSNATQPATLRCRDYGNLTDLTSGTVRVSVQLDAFRYDFEVPAKPRPSS